MEGEKDMSETKKRNMRTRKEKTVARKAIAPKAEETTVGIAVAASDGITTGISNRSAVGASDGITTGVSNGSAVGASDDPMDTYREIKSFYLRSGKPGKMYIDFTGGTKAMSAAATLAGAMIDVQMVYCSTDDYLVDFRKPNPGSERLIYIENPLAVFGELEIEKAFELFDKKNFAGAKEKFSVLKENLPDPALRQQLGFVCLLATAYEAWDALDFVPAYESMQRLQKEIEHPMGNP